MGTPDPKGTVTPPMSQWPVGVVAPHITKPCLLPWRPHTPLLAATTKSGAETGCSERLEDAPSLEMFKARLDGALGSLV